MTSIANNDKKLEIINNLIMNIENNLLTIKKELNNSNKTDINSQSTIYDYNEYFDKKEATKLEKINALNNILNYLDELLDNNISPDDKEKIEQDILFINKTIDNLGNL